MLSEPKEGRRKRMWCEMTGVTQERTKKQEGEQVERQQGPRRKRKRTAERVRLVLRRELTSLGWVVHSIVEKEEIPKHGTRYLVIPKK